MRMFARVLVAAPFALLALAGCGKGDGNEVSAVDDETVNIAATVAEADAKAGIRPQPTIETRDRTNPVSTMAWRGRWAESPAACARAAWQFRALSVATDNGSLCRIRSARQDPLGGDRLRLVCTHDGMKSDEVWFVKPSGDRVIEVTRTAGTEVPKPLTLRRCG